MSRDYDLREDTLAAFPVLLDLLVRLIDSKDGDPIQPGDGWRNDAQRLALKLFQHSVSLKNLTEGATVQFEAGGEIGFIDHGSMSVVARAALEAFLVWHYIYACGDAALGRYRYATWKLAGLMSRQKFKGVGELAAEAKRRDLPELQRLTEEVQRSPYFAELKRADKKDLLGGDWKVLMGPRGWAKAAGFHMDYFNNMYSYFCDYSHSGYLSVMQVGQASSIQDQHRMAMVVLCNVVVILAYFVCSYTKQFPESQHVLDADQLGKAIAEKWALKAEDMAASFGAAG